MSFQQELKILRDSARRLESDCFAQEAEITRLKKEVIKLQSELKEAGKRQHSHKLPEDCIHCIYRIEALKHMEGDRPEMKAGLQKHIAPG